MCARTRQGAGRRGRGRGRGRRSRRRRGVGVQLNRHDGVEWGGAAAARRRGGRRLRCGQRARAASSPWLRRCSPPRRTGAPACFGPARCRASVCRGGVRALGGRWAVGGAAEHTFGAWARGRGSTARGALWQAGQQDHVIDDVHDGLRARAREGRRRWHARNASQRLGAAWAPGAVQTGARSINRR